MVGTNQENMELAWLAMVPVNKNRLLLVPEEVEPSSPRQEC